MSDSDPNANISLTCLRGMRGSKWLFTPEGTNKTLVRGEAFLPDITTAARRDDGRCETSISFDDHDRVVDIVRADKVNAKHGVARLPISAIDYVGIVLGELRIVLHYERKPIHGNPHHGNILFDASLTKHEKNTLASVLALRAYPLPDADDKRD